MRVRPISEPSMNFGMVQEEFLTSLSVRALTQSAAPLPIRVATNQRSGGGALGTSVGRRLSMRITGY
jgi:hypothetical protein